MLCAPVGREAVAPSPMKYNSSVDNLLDGGWFGSVTLPQDCDDYFPHEDKDKSHVWRAAGAPFAGSKDPITTACISEDEADAVPLAGPVCEAQPSPAWPLLTLPALGSISASLIGGTCQQLACAGAPAPKPQQSPERPAFTCTIRHYTPKHSTQIEPSSVAQQAPGTRYPPEQAQQQDPAALAWHMRFRKRWLAAYQPEHDPEPAPLIDPALLKPGSRSHALPVAGKAAVGLDVPGSSGVSPPDSEPAFGSAHAPLLLYGESPSGNDAPLVGHSPQAGPSAGWQHLGAVPAPGPHAAPGAATAAAAGAVTATGADEQGEATVDWVGPLLPEVHIDGGGQFAFVLALVSDSLRGVSKMVLRGRRRANASQLIDDLKLEVARRAMEAWLPVQASVSLITHGSLSMQQPKRVVIACTASNGASPRECTPRTLSEQQRGGSSSSSSASGSTSQSCCGTDASGQSGCGLGTEPCAIVARMLYDVMPWDTTITKA